MIPTDQAHHLRLLALQALPSRVEAPAAARLVAVAGGKGGVGTTTIAVNLAAALARRAHATLLVDADPDAPDIAAMCRLVPQTTVADVLAGQIAPQHALATGPWGLKIFCGTPGPQRPPLAGAAWSKLLVHLTQKTLPLDWVVLDLGDRPLASEGGLPMGTNALLMVTTPEVPAILDTYACIKALCASGVPQPIRLVVNAADSGQQADEVYRRLHRACWRLLGCRLELAAWVARDRIVSAAVALGQPLAQVAPQSRPARQLEELAGRLLSIPRRQTAPSAEGVFSEGAEAGVAPRTPSK